MGGRPGRLAGLVDASRQRLNPRRGILQEAGRPVLKITDALVKRAGAGTDRLGVKLIEKGQARSQKQALSAQIAKSLHEFPDPLVETRAQLHEAGLLPRCAAQRIALSRDV